MLSQLTFSASRLSIGLRCSVKPSSAPLQCVPRRGLCGASASAASAVNAVNTSGTDAAGTAQFPSAVDRVQFEQRGFAIVRNVFAEDVLKELRKRMARAWRGDFELGVYPDEWHWRQGMSLPNVTKEICNIWKCDRMFANVILSPILSAMACSLLGWQGARIAQDDIWDKPPMGTEIAFHRDSDYISKQFTPFANNSITCWIALDDVGTDIGTLEYAVGSHLWPRTKDAASFHAPESDYKADVRRAAEEAGVDFSRVEFVSATMPAGSVAFHHQDMWHGSGRNHSQTRHRRSIGVHLLNEDVTFADDVGYIYGRYKLKEHNKLLEDFFPVTWSTRGYRTPWLAEHCAGSGHAV